MSHARNPELQRLLAALNGTAYSEGDKQTSQEHVNHGVPTHGQDTSVQHEYSPANPGSGLLLVSQTTPQARPSQPTSDPRRKIPIKPTLPATQPEQSRSSTPQASPVSEAESITAWPAALKHVTKHLAPSEQVSQHIKHLLMEQRKHERQWYAQREAIITRHAGRKGNQAKAAALLASLGATAPAPVPTTAATDVNAAADEKKELETFDVKVYKGLVAMAKDFEGQLRKLGVPFFCIKADLVAGESEKGGTNGKVKLSKAELRELQGRMVSLLEDLFGD